MSVFTTVTETELSDWLSHYSLGSLSQLQGIAAGIENTNYFVTTSNGRFVLTLFEKLRPEELPFYLNLMAHLARHGIPCPAPMADHNEQFLGQLNDKPACIVTRLSGRSTTHPNNEQCAAIGSMLAQMHIAGQSFKQMMPNPRGRQWRTETAQIVKPFINGEQQQLLCAEVEQQAQQNWDQLPQGPCPRMRCGGANGLARSGIWPRRHETRSCDACGAPAALGRNRSLLTVAISRAVGETMISHCRRRYLTRDLESIPVGRNHHRPYQPHQRRRSELQLHRLPEHSLLRPSCSLS